MLDEMSGKFGDMVFRQMKDGRTIIARKPDFSNRQFSQDQLSHQERVKLAAAYGKVAAKENPIYAQKAARTNKTAYNLAFKDWFHPPEVCSIRFQDRQLQVHARDDVRVSRVTLFILGPEGEVLEQGDAESACGFFWDYQPAHKGRILVQVTDLPGNVTQHEFCPPPGEQSFWDMKR